MASTDETDDGATVEVTDRGTERIDATQVLPGDDITVIPDPHDGGNRRRTAWIAGGVAAIVLLGGAAVLATRDDDPNASVATDVSPTPIAETPNAGATTPPKVKKPAPTTIPTRQVTPGTAAAPEPVPPSAPAVVPPPTVPPAAATTAVPAAAPTSSIKWTAPASVTVKTGKSVVIAVSAHNPAAGVISLPQQLSCAPTLDNSGMCAQVVQKISPGQTTGAQWTVSAAGIAPGNYTLNYAGLLKIPVTVTA